MSEARAAILAALRAASGRVSPVRAATPAPLPAVSAGLIEAFSRRLTSAAGAVTLLPDEDALGPAVADYLARHGLGSKIAAAPHPLLDRITWPAALALHRRQAQAEDRAALTVAFAGVAETGSLVMVSGPETPTTLNFLPEHCLVVLVADRLFPHLESVWPRLRALGPLPPRAVNIITGPSRTADVEQTIQLGAHGPRQLQVFLLARRR